VKYERFLDRATVVPPAVVLGVFIGPNEIGVARSLGRRGVPVLAMNNDRHGFAVPSRYAAKMLCPDPHHDEAGFVHQLERAGRELPQKAVLFPGRDDFVLPVAAAAARLGEHFLTPFSALPVMTRMLDKWEQMEGARRAGVDMPHSALLLSAEDAASAAGDVPFPAILKPTTPQAGERHLGAKVLLVGTAAELPAAYEEASACGPLLLQEYIPGEDDETYYLGAYLDAESRPLAVFTGRRLRQHPRGFGDARSAESVWVPQVADAGLRLLQEMRFHGVAHVEFKRDPRDGRFKLMEVNARHYGTHSLAAACGVDLSVVAYADALGRPIIAPRQREGVKWLMATRDFVASPQEILRGELTLSEWLTSLRGTRVEGIFSFDDPLPGVAGFVHKVIGVARRSLDLAKRSVKIGAASPSERGGDPT
jgi:predicted ATP-grasp superfamily ATP-dependent carboligase